MTKEKYTLVGYDNIDANGDIIAQAPETFVVANSHRQHIWHTTALTVSPPVAARVRRALGTDHPRIWIAGRLIDCQLEIA